MIRSRLIIGMLIAAVFLLGCVVSYNQGYKQGFLNGQLNTIQMFSWPFKK